jgi:hypothetical protein
MASVYLLSFALSGILLIDSDVGGFFHTDSEVRPFDGCGAYGVYPSCPSTANLGPLKVIYFASLLLQI